jgi:nickel transport protein
MKARRVQPIHLFPRQARRLFGGALCGALVFSLCVATSARAHGTRATVVEKQTVCVFFAFDDDEPMGYARVKIEAPGLELPFQSGATDMNGMICFAPDRDGQWQVSAGDEMGHMQRVVVPVSANRVEAPGQEPSKAGSGSPPERMGRVIGGVGIILGVTGIIGLWQARRRKNAVK